jgi:hypothetical protein
VSLLKLHDKVIRYSDSRIQLHGEPTNLDQTPYCKSTARVVRKLYGEFDVVSQSNAARHCTSHEV